MKDLIVETDIVCIDDKAERHPMTVEIGRPYPVGQDFACHVALRGLHDHLAPIVGGDQMQTLVLAITFIRALLRPLEEKGYKILFPEDTEENVNVSEIWFSSLPETGNPNQAMHRTK